MTPKRFVNWPPPSTECRTVTLRIPPSRIGLVSSLVEAYEGVAIIRTADREAGIVDLWVMPGQIPVVEAVLGELESQFSILRIRDIPGHPDLEEEGNEPNP